MDESRCQESSWYDSLVDATPSTDAVDQVVNDLRRWRPDLEVVGLPITFDRKRPTPARSAPKLGEHTDEVLDKL